MALVAPTPYMATWLGGLIKKSTGSGPWEVPNKGLFPSRLQPALPLLRSEALCLSGHCLEPDLALEHLFSPSRVHILAPPPCGGQAFLP